MEELNQRPEILAVIQKVSRAQGVDHCQITHVETNQKGEGYLGEIYLVTVRDEDDENFTLDIVIKAAFINPKIRETAPIRKCFQNEVNFYSAIMPQMKEFAKEHGAVLEPFVPKCYDVSLEEGGELLVLENLRKSHYEVFDKKSTLDEAHMELIFKTYGQFHAYSFALRAQAPDLYKNLHKSIVNVFENFLENSMFIKSMAAFSDMAKKCLDVNDKLLAKYTQFEGSDMSNTFKEVTLKECDYPAIIHGDCWSNNMMFKYEESQGCKIPSEIRLLDWQLLKIGSPVCDLSYCLYSGTSKKVFDQLDSLLRVYHGTFSSTLKMLGCDAEKLFPFEALKSEWKKYARFGFIMSLSIWRMKMTNKEDLVDFTDFPDGFDNVDFDEAISRMKFDEDAYRARIREILEHLDEIDAL